MGGKSWKCRLTMEAPVSQRPRRPEYSSRSIAGNAPGPSRFAARVWDSACYGKSPKNTVAASQSGANRGEERSSPCDCPRYSEGQMQARILIIEDESAL